VYILLFIQFSRRTEAGTKRQVDNKENVSTVLIIKYLYLAL